MAFSNPSLADFVAYYTRDFPFGTDIESEVLDSDITKAFVQTNGTIPQNLFTDQASYTVGYLLLAAHFLVLNLRASSQGLNGQYSFIESGKSVGSVSESFAVPEDMTKNVMYAFYAKTNYGAQYLFMIRPLLVAPGFAACGRTKP